ncbi:MAG: STAS-like domain-containing protein [Acidobacteriia bacterium]|nr:STAS-like domain-containing protein [Terriglobia bacterium]
MAISVARDFSQTPGPRSREEGDFSGEEFLETLLRPQFVESVAAGQKLNIDLDGTEGYATSFLEAAFGGLAREYEASKILDTLTFKCEDEPYLVQEITKYIKEARKK